MKVTTIRPIQIHNPNLWGAFMLILFAVMTVLLVVLLQAAVGMR